MDFKLPQHSQIVDKLTLFLTLANADGSNAWEADQSTPFWTRGIEIRQGGEVVQTIESLDAYLRTLDFECVRPPASPT